MRLGLTARLAAGLAGWAVCTALLRLGGILNPTAAALLYLLVVLFAAAVSTVTTAVFTSIAAALAFNYFFLPPVGTLSVADAQNWVAFVVFLVVSIVASKLSTGARARAAEAQRATLSSALLASLSHDLRTPLTAIRTAVSNLDSAAMSEEQRREQARVASEEIQRLMRVFDEILDMAKIDAGGVRPHRAWGTPAETVGAAAAP